ncbi:MAG TPA: hypothetical protein VF701_04985 [Thermoanaerobaculia bacterium]
MLSSLEMIPRDTTPVAAAMHEAALRRLGPAERLRIAFELSDLTHRLAVEGIRRRNPECGEEEAIRILARALYGVET